MRRDLIPTRSLTRVERLALEALAKGHSTAPEIAERLYGPRTRRGMDDDMYQRLGDLSRLGYASYEHRMNGHWAITDAGRAALEAGCDA